MKKKKYLIFNFKSAVLTKEKRKKIYQIFNNAKQNLFSKYYFILAPSAYYFLEFSKEINQKILFASQNIFWVNKKLVTGETPPLMIKDLKINYTILGHSERKEFLKENEKMINLKLKSCFQSKIIPIICLGEKEKSTDFQIKKVLFSQLNQIFEGIILRDQAFLLAYEPVWAIGSGLTPTIDELQKRIEIIRFWLGTRFNEKVTSNTPILYGGSITEKNAENFLKEKNIDGLLMGGLSSQPNRLEKLIKKIDAL
ncbi:MAG: triose-phosphate isomerase [Minisyncoccia bacterium]